MQCVLWHKNENIWHKKIRPPQWDGLIKFIIFNYSFDVNNNDKIRQYIIKTAQWQLFDLRCYRSTTHDAILSHVKRKAYCVFLEYSCGVSNFPTNRAQLNILFGWVIFTFIKFSQFTMLEKPNKNVGFFVLVCRLSDG